MALKYLTLPYPIENLKILTKPGGNREHQKGTLSWVGVVFLLHSLGLALLFQPVSGLWSQQPVIEQDWGLHFHHLNSLDELWRGDRRLWGYNPFFMAGYPSNTIQDLSIKLFELLSLLLSAPGLNLTLAFKLTVVVTMAAIPWMIFFAARMLFDEEPAQRLAPPLAAFLGTAYWWNSLPREMFFYGVLGFPPACYLSLLGLALFCRMSKAERPFTAAHTLWLVVVAAIVPLHFQATLVIALPIAAFLLVHRKSLDPRALFWLAGGALASVLVNLAWLLPAITHRGDEVSSTIVAQLPLFSSTDPLTFIKDYASPSGYWTFRTSAWEKGLRWTLLILGWMGVAKLLRDGRKDLALVIGIAAGTLFAVAYFGSFIPILKGWQPLRFKVGYDLYLVLAASYLISTWKSSRAEGSGQILIPILLLGGGMAFFVNLAQTESTKSMTLRTELSPEVKAIVEWIRTETPTEGRLLFEESGDETGFVYDGMYLSAFIPYWTGRQLIGGPINLYNDRHHFAEFHSGMLFKSNIAGFTDNEIRDYLRAYNVGAVVAFHPRSIQRLLSVPGLISLDHRIGDIHLMKVNQPLTWVLQGKGNIEAGLNRIRVFNIAGDEVLLKYHWTEGLISDPPATIRPEKILDDPIPFIRIVNPPPELTLRIGR